MMPVVFVGHGSPMNIIEENRFTKTWAEMAQLIPAPNAILCVSAHWFTDGEFVSSVANPETIHDFYGFPSELYTIQYPAPGAPDLAQRIQELRIESEIQVNPSRGIDHGTWSVLRTMYPNADIPVCQLSVNALNSPKSSYLVGRSLRSLREEGVLIIGSGNIVHNLPLIDWNNKSGGFSWADDFDSYIHDALIRGDHNAVIDYPVAGTSARQAFSYRDHFDPLLYALGATEQGESVQSFNYERTLGSISMTSYIFGL